MRSVTAQPSTRRASTGDDISASPSWDEVRALIVRRPKPPIRATVTDTSRTPPRRLRVIHDGLDGWLIEEGARIEMSAGKASTVLFDGRELAGFRGQHVSSDTHVKSMFEGRLMASIDEASGTVIGREVCAGRKAWVVDVEGLRREGEDRFRLSVDAEHGFVLRLEGRDGVVAMDDVVIGTLQGVAGPIP
jgi:hypothetical protein